VLVDLEDRVVVLLSHQNASVLCGKNPVGAVAGGLPDFRPLPARGDDAGDRGDIQVARGRLRCWTAPPLTWFRSRSTAAAGRGRRRNARRRLLRGCLRKR